MEKTVGGRRGGAGRFGGFAIGGRLLGAGAVAVGIKQSVDAASDFNEQVSKTEVVFGRNAQAVKDWSETTTNAFGLSRREALATASSLGALFAPLRIIGPEAARQAQKLTELGADLASFYNTDVQEALDAIKSGLVGEAEPLRRYGVLLSETRVAQQAMADTGKKNATQLTAQEKALARVALIVKDTKQAQGDFARTSENLANQTRKLKANWDDFSVTMGETVIPVVNAAFGEFNDFFALLRDNARIGTETFEKGSKLETSLVPNLAKQIQAMKRAGKTSEEILATLRKRLGGSLKADDLIAEAFRFTVDPKLRARIKKAAEDVKKVVDDEAAKAARKRGPSVELRNTVFDQMVSRQLDRVQDLSLRKQLDRLKAIGQEVRARLSVTKDATRRLTLEDKLLEVARQQKAVQQEITDKILAGNQALKDRAEAIKSAVLERLQRRQTDVLNKRALADAKERLRIARQLGGPGAIREAGRGVEDVRFDMLRARIERAPASLTRGGRFQLAGSSTSTSTVSPTRRRWLVGSTRS